MDINCIHIKVPVGQADGYETGRTGLNSEVQMTRQWEENGERKYQGGDDLKASQHYPMGFGLAVDKLLEEHEGELAKRAADLAIQAQVTSLLIPVPPPVLTVT